MYQSIPSLTIPRAIPGDSHVLTAKGVLPNFLCPAHQGFELEKFPTVLKEKCRNFSTCFRKNRRQLEKQMFLCCFISIAKTVDVYFIFNNRPFSAFTPGGSLQLPLYGGVRAHYWKTDPSAD